MKRFDCLRHLSSRIDDELIVIGMTGQYWEWNHLLPDHEGNMKVGGLGFATAVGLGMAMALPNRRVIVLDSDGSTLFDLPSLPTLGAERPPNLKVLVFDNESYTGSRISEPSATAFNTDLEALALSAGITNASTVRTIEAFEQACDLAFSRDELEYVIAKVEFDDETRRLPKPNRDFLENKYQFVRYIERTENKKIFRAMMRTMK